VSGEFVGVLAEVGAGGIIPADRSIAIANARERRRIPRFMLDTFGWRGRKTAANATAFCVSFRLPRFDPYANKEIFK
jgi:hypothetical protein